jgi:hypothetical protein
MRKLLLIVSKPGSLMTQILQCYLGVDDVMLPHPTTQAEASNHKFMI